MSTLSTRICWRNAADLKGSGASVKIVLPLSSPEPFSFLLPRGTLARKTFLVPRLRRLREIKRSVGTRMEIEQRCWISCERFALIEPENYKRFTVPHILEINTTSFDHTWYFGSSYSPSRSELHQAYYALLFPSRLFAYHANQTLTTDTRYCAKKKTSQIWKSLHVFTDAQENFLRRICSTMFPTRQDRNCS